MGTVYVIQNTVNNRTYVGRTTMDIRQRFNYHKWCLREDSHKNSYLQRDWNKYGGDYFEFKVIEDGIEEDKLDEYEMFWIQSLRSMYYQDSYNMQGGGIGGTPSVESKEKMSRAHRNKILSEEHKEEISKSLTGRNLSDEHKKNLSRARNNASRETGIRISQTKKEWYRNNESPRNKKARVISSGKIYKSAKVLAEKEGVSRSTVVRHCNNYVKNPRYEYI